MTDTQPYKKKLIEVAIPLEAINKESAREKSIRHGHPSTLHLWWARRPLAACRAVLFASLVDDPSSHPDQFPNEAAQEMERRRLFKIIEDLVKWENVNNEEVLAKAKAEIMRSTDNNPPAVLDPFCGGGSIPLEAQRLGLEAHGSDLNPVAVLITKALIEIPPKFAGKAPVNHNVQKLKKKQTVFKGAEGLAADVEYYGGLMRDEAYQKIGKLYPKIKLPKDQGGGEANVIAWIWARTVKCPNPACGCEMPLVRSFALSSKKDKEAWIEPIIKKGKPPQIEFVVKYGKGEVLNGVVNRRGAKCICCESPVPFDHVRTEGKAGRMGQRLMAIVAEGPKGRVYLSPEDSHIKIAISAKPNWKPENELPHNPRDFKTPNYGLKTFGDLFTNRQLVALTTFSDLVGETREKIIKEAIAAGMKDDGKGLEEGGLGATAYADTVSIYLSFAIGKAANLWSTITTWMNDRGAFRETFARQAIPMTWDFAEANPFSESGGNYLMFIERGIDSIKFLPTKIVPGLVEQRDARIANTNGCMISTDPPYYDNIGYADLSDFFYVWIRRSLAKVKTHITSTILVPKDAELIASPYRNGDQESAKRYFEDGFCSVFRNVLGGIPSEYPMTIYYAYKQTESVEDEDAIGQTTSENRSSTGWQTILNAIISSGFSVVGTWPLRTEGSGRLLAKDTNALASSIAIVCRPRSKSARSITLQDFKRQLRRELKNSIKELLQSNIAPVDLPQSAIGPGIAIYSAYRSVLDINGEPISISSALMEINKTLTEYLDESSDQFDQDTLWAIEWYKLNGYEFGLYGDADNLARAKNTSVEGVVTGGIAAAKAGKVSLIKRKDLRSVWDPTTDKRTSTWEKMQYLVKVLEERGETETAKLIEKLGPTAEDAKSLAYRIFAISEAKGWVEEARAFNALIMSWSEINRLTA